MAKNRLSAADGPGFLRAMCDNWRDAELEYGVLLFLAVEPTAQKGVLEHRLTAWYEGDRRGQRPQAAYRAPYPSSAVQTYEAFMLQLVLRLTRILEQQRKWPEGKA